MAACCHLTPALAEPLACDDGIKTAFRPDADTSVIAVRLVKKGEELKAPDVPQPPITAAADLCLVKLLVGPGATAEKDKTARSYSEGIGIEVWLPTHANWNERIRNYGGGGWVGGGHRYADKIGSKVPAIVNANIGYASGTTDAGQPWYQDGSFAFLSDGKVNAESLRDFSVRAMVEQAVKTKALVNLYYGKAPKYAYYDGHSQGGRQGMKLVQEYPELYDGYMIAPAGAEHREIRNGGALSADRDEDRARLHRGEQGRGHSLCRQGRRRQQARGCRLRQGRASASCSIPLPATTIPRATPTCCARARPAKA